MVKGGKWFETTTANPIPICPTFAGEDAGGKKTTKKTPCYSDQSHKLLIPERNVKFDVRRCKSSFLRFAETFCCAI